MKRKMRRFSIDIISLTVLLILASGIGQADATETTSSLSTYDYSTGSADRESAIVVEPQPDAHHTQRSNENDPVFGGGNSSTEGIFFPVPYDSFPFIGGGVDDDLFGGGSADDIYSDNQHLVFTLPGWSDLSIIEANQSILSFNPDEVDELHPHLSLPAAFGDKPYNTYAGLKISGMYYIAQINYKGEVDFFPLDMCEGIMPEYGTEYIEGDTWTCSAFDNLDLGTLSMMGDIVFYFAVAPVDGSIPLMGAAFRIVEQ